MLASPGASVIPGSSLGCVSRDIWPSDRSPAGCGAAWGLTTCCPQPSVLPSLVAARVNVDTRLTFAVVPSVLWAAQAPGPPQPGAGMYRGVATPPQTRRASAGGQPHGGAPWGSWAQRGSPRVPVARSSVAGAPWCPVGARTPPPAHWPGDYLLKIYFQGICFVLFSHLTP